MTDEQLASFLGAEDPADEALPPGTPRPALTSISVRRSGASVLASAVDVESTQVIAIPGRRIAVTVVEFPDESQPYQVLVGSALVRGDVEDALARSVLSALNRRLNI